MTPSDWLDTGCRPPQRLPESVEAALEYLAHALGRPLYLRWTLAALKRGCPSLADAKREHPAVFALLLDHDAPIEYAPRHCEDGAHQCHFVAAPGPTTTDSERSQNGLATAANWVTGLRTHPPYLPTADLRNLA